MSAGKKIGRKNLFLFTLPLFFSYAKRLGKENREGVVLIVSLYLFFLFFFRGVSKEGKRGRKTWITLLFFLLIIFKRLNSGGRENENEVVSWSHKSRKWRGKPVLLSSFSFFFLLFLKRLNSGRKRMKMKVCFDPLISFFFFFLWGQLTKNNNEKNLLLASFSFNFLSDSTQEGTQEKWSCYLDPFLSFCFVMLVDKKMTKKTGITFLCFFLFYFSSDNSGRKNNENKVVYWSLNFPFFCGVSEQSKKNVIHLFFFYFLKLLNSGRKTRKMKFCLDSFISFCFVKSVVKKLQRKTCITLLFFSFSYILKRLNSGRKKNENKVKFWSHNLLFLWGQWGATQERKKHITLLFSFFYFLKRLNSGREAKEI